MNIGRACKAAIAIPVSSGPALAEEVTLPAPVLEWSVYILLIFAACVAIGHDIQEREKHRCRDAGQPAE